VRKAKEVAKTAVGDADRADLTLRLLKSLQPAPIADRPHSWDY